MTHLLGKSKNLEETLIHQEALLTKLGIEVEFLHWQNPVPGIWSVHLQLKNAPMLFVNGKGTLKDAAKASALGELFERLASGYWFADDFLGQGDLMYPDACWVAVDKAGEQLLTPELWQYYDPECELHFEALISPQFDRTEILALPFVGESYDPDSQKVQQSDALLFPLNLIHSLYASNGLSSGNDLLETKIQAWSEIAERYVKFEVLRNLIVPPQIPQEVIAPLGRVAEITADLQKAGFAVRLLDASLGGQWPVVAALVTQISTGRTLLSFGAHPLVSVALERALTEAFQGRALNQVNDWFRPTADEELVAMPDNLEQHFVDSNGWISYQLWSDQPSYAPNLWPAQPDNNTLLWHWCLGQTQAAGFQLYVREEGLLDWPVVRLIVPGMSEVYPLDDLWDANPAGYGRWRKLWQSGASLSECMAVADEEGWSEHLPLGELLGVRWPKGDWMASLRLADIRMLACLEHHDADWTAEATMSALALHEEDSSMQTLGAIVLALSQGIAVDLLKKIYGEQVHAVFQAWTYADVRYLPQWMAKPYDNPSHMQCQAVFNEMVKLAAIKVHPQP